MKKVQAKEVPVEEFACVIFGGKKVTKAICQNHGEVFQRNKDNCHKYACASPWRKCYKCISMGRDGNSSVVVDPRTGLCKEHMAFAEEDALLKKLRRAYSDFVLLDEVRRLTVEDRKELAHSARRKFLQKRAHKQGRLPGIGEVGIINVGLIRPRYDQPRQASFNISTLFELARSREVKQVIAIIVRPLKNDPDGFLFEILDGERRYIAALIAGVNEIRAEVDGESDDKKAFLASAIANFCQEPHTPLEACQMIARIMKEHDLPVSAAAEMLGKSDVWGQMHLRLANLHPSIVKMLEEEKISVTTASELGKHPQDFQLKTLDRIIRERLTTIAAKMHIRTELRKDGLPLQTGKRGRVPSDDYELLRSFCKGAIVKADYLLNMGEEVLHKMFVHRNPGDKKLALAELDSLIERITDIKEAINN